MEKEKEVPVETTEEDATEEKVGTKEVEAETKEEGKQRRIETITALTSFAVLIVLTLSITFYPKVYRRPDYPPHASVIHSTWREADDGTTYRYYVYEKPYRDGEYFYVKTKADVTIEGPCDERQVGSGELRNRNDLAELERDVKGDVGIGRSFVTFSFEEDGPRDETKSFEEFAKRLFEEPKEETEADETT